MNARIVFRVATAAFTFTVSAHHARAEYMYWTDTWTRTISRAKTDGTARQVIVDTSNLTGPRGIALDQAAGKLYWTDEGRDVLERSNLDGSNREILVSDLVGPRGVALDFAAQKVYWVERFADRIGRADLDGQNVEIVLSTGLTDPLQIALDPTAGHMYLSDTGGEGIAPGGILRANLDGTGLTTLIGGLGDPAGIALDLTAGRMYWNDAVQDTISSADLDGFNVTTLVSTGLVFPLGLAVDLATGKVYWTDVDAGPALSGLIQRSDLDGSDVETLVSTGLSNPRDIAIEAECVGAADGDLCFDGDPCTSNDVCQNGHCAGTIAPASCDDHDPCTVNDQCLNGFCAGTLDLSACFHLFLMVTQVNSVPCPSCPTSNLPVEEVRPGDVITIEAYMAHWDDEPDTGICENQNQCSMAAQDCTSMHCQDGSDYVCSSDMECGTLGPCIPDHCRPNPRVIAYQWALDQPSFSSGLAGYLTPYGVSCSSDSDCTHDLPNCTCTMGSCSSGVCNIHGTYYVDASRPDFLFADEPSIQIVSPAVPPFAGAVSLQSSEGGAADVGNGVYLGTLLLKSSVTARGTFTVDVDHDQSRNTFVLDQNGLFIVLGQFFPATINFCPLANSPNDCNQDGYPDECEPDLDSDGIIDDCDPCPTDPANDTDGDGVCDADDGCPLDPNKSSPGLCGCGLLDDGDSDADAVLDCIDLCPGGDDALFAPDCLTAIPAASTWGLIVLTLLLLAGAKLAFPRRATV